jgi:acetyl-CoA synthetase
MNQLDTFLAARDQLLANRTRYAQAVAQFKWPVLSDFNWATDYFDVVAADNSHPALNILEESGARSQLTYAQLSVRSTQVANFLYGLGARSGDRILLMLGNEVPLWETMLASIKLGTVVIPATTLLSGADLADRIKRGNIKFVVTNAVGQARFNELPVEARAGLTLINVVAAGKTQLDRAFTGWVNYQDSATAPTTLVAVPRLSVHAPMLEYFTSGTTAQPKLVRHTRQSYPVGHLTTLYWLGLQPGDVHWTISSPGWAKHAWSCFFAPFNAQACVFIYNYTRFNGPAILETLVREGVQTLCAPPTVWRMLIQEDLKRWPIKLREVISAGEPLNPEVIEQVRVAWGLNIRDSAGRQLAGLRPQAGLDGAAAARLHHRTARPGRQARRRRRNLYRPEGASAESDGGLRGRLRQDRRGDARRLLPHRRCGRARCTGLHHLRWPGR